MDDGASTASAGGSCHEAKASRFLHSFGYHLAKRLVGSGPIDRCISQAYDELRQQQQLQQQQPSSTSASDEGNTLFHAFRSNWRSNARFPWQLIAHDATSGLKGKGSDWNSDVDIQSLFVDITFDFLVSPSNLAVDDIGNSIMMHSYHVLKEKDLRKESNNALKDDAIQSSITVAVAIRIGALLALPTSRIKDPTATSTVRTDEDDGRISNIHSFDKSLNDDSYRYYYHRGNTALTISDLNEHCKSIDIVLEEMDPVDVARIFGDAFIEGCRSGGSWEIVSKKRTLGDTGIDTCTNNSSHYMKLHHGVLQAGGVLPLSETSRIGDGGSGGNGSIEPIHRSILDMILLQSTCGGCNGSCVAVPRPEALSLWRTVDPSIVTIIEAQSTELQQRQYIHTTGDISTEAAVVIPTTNNSNPSATAVPADVTMDTNKLDETNQNSRRYKNGKSLLNIPPQQHTESALFARVKATTHGGSRKKPKFRFGPA